MDKEHFDLFIGILRILEKEDHGNNTVESSIVSLIDAFESRLSQEQKNEILKEFVKYERIRKAGEETERRKEAVNQMKYRDIVEAAIRYEAGT